VRCRLGWACLGSGIPPTPSGAPQWFSVAMSKLRKTILILVVAIATVLVGWLILIALVNSIEVY